jgi:hypothetical protein
MGRHGRALEPRRWDVYVYNEATGFIVTSRALGGRGFGPSDKRWARAFAAREILPLELAQDDPFIVRVVLGGALSDEESAEAVGRIDTALELGDELVVAGGVEYVTEGEAWAEEFVRIVPVPAGSYRAQILTYLPGLNGDACLRAAGGDPDALGAWWKKSRGRKPPPAWIRGEEEAGAPVEHVQFLVHLTPLDGTPPVLPPLDGGFVSCTAGARKPEVCPAGLIARDVTGRLAALPPRAVEVVDLAPIVGRFELTPLDRPLELPLENLERLYLLAWLASNDAHPELRVRLPAGVAFDVAWPTLDHAAIVRDAGGLRIGMEASGERWAGVRLLQVFGPALASLPDGSVVELASARLDRAEHDPRAALQRYRGTVRRGTLTIADSYPAVPARVLEAGLELARALERGNTLPLGDADGLAVLELIRRNDGLMFRQSIVEVRGRELVLTSFDEDLLSFAAVYLFRLRFGATWPVIVWDPAQATPRGTVDRERKRFVGDRVPGQLVHAGRSASFHEGNAAAVLPSLASVDAELADAGFLPLGDLICSKLPTLILRGYAHESGTAFGSLALGRGLRAFDMFSVLGNGARATTTTNARATTDEQRRIFGFARPDLALGRRPGAATEIVEAHLRETKRLARAHGTCRRAPAELRAFAASLDDALVLWGL